MTGILGIGPVAGVESPRNGEFLATEAHGERSRGAGTLAVLNDGASSYLSGVVLGKQTVGSKAAFALGAGDTAVLTCGTITLSAGALQGTYEAIAVTSGATALYELFNPLGVFVGMVKVGTAFSGGGLAFTLSNTTNSVVGDTFTITVGTASFALGGSDTGNPTCGAIVVQPGVYGGTYTFTAISATQFTGMDPFGNVLPVLTLGTAYNGGGLTFTVSAGGMACVAGDTFTITAYTGNDYYYPVNASAFDGTQNAAAILLLQTYVGGSTPVMVAIIERDAEVVADRLVWPSTITDDQQRNWNQQLKALGIISRRDLV